MDRDRPNLVALIHDPDLVDSVHRLAAAAGLPLEVLGQGETMPPRSVSAGLVVDTAAAAVVAAQPVRQRRSRTIIVTRQEPTGQSWRHAVALQAEQVIVLPEGQQQVLDWLAEVTESRGVPGVSVAVMGTRGGAGASTLAACLARVAARHRHHDVTLIDFDDLAGGLELLLGCEDTEGLRWGDIADSRGRLGPSSLAAALPSDAGVRVLSWGPGDSHQPTVAVVHEVLDAARRGADLVVVDLPRGWSVAASHALTLVDTLLLVCPSDVRGVAGAARLLRGHLTPCDDVRVVVRTERGSLVDPRQVAERLDIPLAGVVPTTRGLGRTVAEGLGPPTSGRLARAARQLLAGVAAGPVPQPSGAEGRPQ